MNSLELVGGSQPSGVPSQGLGDHEIKHLDLVQSVISRMAQNSFHLKGWSVTVATAIFAFAAKESSPGFAVLALFPAVAFWCLDAYYLKTRKTLQEALRSDRGSPENCAAILDGDCGVHGRS